MVGGLGDGERVSDFRLGLCGDVVGSCPFVYVASCSFVKVASCPFVNGLSGPCGCAFLLSASDFSRATLF